MAKGSNESDVLAASGTTDAAEYTLSNGRNLNEADIEARAALWESGEWTGELVALRVGRPRLSPTEPNPVTGLKGALMTAVRLSFSLSMSCMLSVIFSQKVFAGMPVAVPRHSSRGAAIRSWHAAGNPVRGRMPSMTGSTVSLRR